MTRTAMAIATYCRNGEVSASIWYRSSDPHGTDWRRGPCFKYQQCLFCARYLMQGAHCKVRSVVDAILAGSSIRDTFEYMVVALHMRTTPPRYA